MQAVFGHEDSFENHGSEEVESGYYKNSLAESKCRRLVSALKDSDFFCTHAKGSYTWQTWPFLGTLWYSFSLLLVRPQKPTPIGMTTIGKKMSIDFPQTDR